MKILVLVLPVLLIGCAQTTSKKMSEVRSAEKASAALAQENHSKELRERRETDKDKALLLAKLKSEKKSSITDKSYGSLAGSMAQQADAPVLGKWLKLREFDLYRECLNAYDANDEVGFNLGSKAFLKRFPKSSLVDDVLYLSGLMSLTDRDYGVALKLFNQVLKKHATGNRASSALFAKGITLKRMNLNEQAQGAFLQIKKKFAGSPEALRAESELKLLR